MNLSRLKLRQKLLILLFGVGGIGLTSYSLVLAYSYYQLSAKFIPENRALREVESRSALLLQNYFRFMLTPDLVDIDGFGGEIILIRQNLGIYRRLSEGESQKEQLATKINDSINGLERAGAEMISAGQDTAHTLARQEQLENDVNEVFSQYRSAVSNDIGKSIESQNWADLTKDYLPELRMIDSVNQQFLTLSLKIREYAAEPGGTALGEMDRLEQRIKLSHTMLELYVANSNYRAQLSAQIISIYQQMLAVVEAYTMARQRAEFAFTQAEQFGIDLNESMINAVEISDSISWNDYRASLFLSGGILFLTLITGYLLIYLGLDRILRPLETLHRVIDFFGKGDLGQRSENTGRADEIGLLANAFNKMADELEQNVEHKQQLINQLEQKNLELERFNYTVSHELKSPLVTIGGFLGHLERDLAEGNRESVDKDMLRISSAIKTMDKQLRDLLELSRIGPVINPPTCFSMTRPCQEVIEIIQGTIDEYGAKIEVQEQMPQVLADQARIREVIKNLVENGIKFTSVVRQPRIMINAEQVEDKVHCRVQDNGPGIEPRYQDRVFRLFDRLETEVQGTGVGLALVKRIIDIHDGDIWIESEGNGQGCCFCFTLPAHGGA